jgi:Fe-S-cluster containining protein
MKQKKKSRGFVAPLHSGSIGVTGTEWSEQNSRSLNMTVMEEYRLLLEEIDRWFSLCMQRHPKDIACGKGCSECCRGLFDITIIDAALLQAGFRVLPEEIRTVILEKGAERLGVIRSYWPEFDQPFILNHRSEDDREALMATDDESPCILLDPEGKCLLYAYRPMTCRLHGLPLIDISGEVMESEWCTLNFTATNPLQLENLHGEFARMFSSEAAIGRNYTEELLGKAVSELDTVIPAALLIDFRKLYRDR